MRIAFFGATELGWQCCRVLVDMNQEIVGIFTIPREFKISWSIDSVTNVQYQSFEGLARDAKSPLYYYSGSEPMSSLAANLKSLAPDIVIVIGWYYMIPPSIRSVAPLGTVGIHGSLLPKYRGGAPLVWAVINGEPQTGVSLFHLEDGIDNGDIVGQLSFDISHKDDIAIVLENATKASIELLKSRLPQIESGNAPRLRQNEVEATIFPQREPKDGLIVWREKSAVQAYDWIRAQSRPYPGAFTYFEHQKVVIWKAAPTERRVSLLPGTILIDSFGMAGSLGVACADNCVLDVLEVELADGRVLTGAEFVDEHRLRHGSSFGG